MAAEDSGPVRDESHPILMGELSAARAEKAARVIKPATKVRRAEKPAFMTVFPRSAFPPAHNTCFTVGCNIHFSNRHNYCGSHNNTCNARPTLLSWFATNSAKPVSWTREGVHRLHITDL